MTAVAGGVLVDRDLARRLESDQVMATRECAASLGRLVPERDVAVLDIGTGCAVWAGPRSFFSEACGLGMDGTISDDELRSIGDFYATRGGLARIEVCPLADPTLWSLASLGYRVHEFQNVLVMPLESAPAEPPPAAAAAIRGGVCVRPATREERGTWVETCARGFVDDPAERESQLVEFLAMAELERTRLFLALVDGVPAGAAAWAERDGLAGLFATSVLPDSRGRGVHAALIDARLAAARAAGCDLATAVALPGSRSQRNFQRAGFHPAYTKVVLRAVEPAA